MCMLACCVCMCTHACVRTVVGCRLGNALVTLMQCTFLIIALGRPFVTDQNSKLSVQQLWIRVVFKRFKVSMPVCAKFRNLPVYPGTWS